MKKGLYLFIYLDFITCTNLFSPHNRSDGALCSSSSIDDLEGVDEKIHNVPGNGDTDEGECQYMDLSGGQEARTWTSIIALATMI